MAKREHFKEVKTAWTAGSNLFRFASGAIAFGSAVNQAMQQPVEIKEQIDPMMGLASAEELKRYKYTPEGFYLGHVHDDHGVNFKASIPADDDRHVFIVAGTASGKGVSYGVQNALRWRGGLLAIDPKGEMAEITAMHRGARENALGSGTSVRKFKGQQVAILDPMNVVRGPAKKYRVNYNPLAEININDKGGFRQIKKMAAGMIIPEEGNAAHFSQSAETLLAGMIEAVLMLEDKADHNLPFLRRKILGNVKLKNEDDLSANEIADIEMGFQALYTYLSDDELSDDGHAAEAASVLGEVLGSDEAGSFRTTLSRNLKWIADPDMKTHLQSSDFSLWETVQAGGSVYIVLKPDDIGDFKNWLRMMVQISLSAKMAKGTFQDGLQTLFFLDEFFALGRFKEIEESAGYMRGYALKLCPIIQNIGQVKSLYGKNWETFLGSAAAIVAWGLNDLETEQYISDRMGKIVVPETSFSRSSSAQGLSGGTSTNESTALRERAIRFSNEIHEQGARESMRAFIVPASGKPFTVRRVPYMELVQQKIFDSPQFIRDWEAKNEHD